MRSSSVRMRRGRGTSAHCRRKLPSIQLLLEPLPLADIKKEACQRRTANTAARTVAASISRAMTQPCDGSSGASVAAT